MTTPAKIRSGDTQERSNEKTTAITLVPTSAPSITASAALVATRFLPTNDATIRHVAVLDRVRPEMTVVREETFGPVSPIVTFRDIDDAIRIANGTAYGLSSAVCTNRLDAIARFVSELDVGTVNVREVPGYRLELTPFGGIKDSGLGYKEGVQEAMKSFTNLKTYSLPWN